MSETLPDLTDQEAELYDRQIRLWGVEAQKRLGAVKVLVIGLQGLGCEVTKNLILAGIKSITLLDHEVLGKNDGCTQFLAPLEKIGQNRAEASLERAQELNPLVQVSADSSNAKDKPNSYFLQFNVVFASKCPVDVMIRINFVCRYHNVMFFCGDVFGMFGYMFTDLKIHKYTVEITDLINGTLTKRTQENTAKYVSLESALNVDWKTEGNIRRMKKCDPSYFLMKVLLRFRGEQNRDPCPATREKDQEILKELRKKELTQLGVPLDKIPDHLLKHTIQEISPICSILGGIVGWEIIKSVSYKETPVNNFFFFDPVKCTGFTELIGFYK